MKPEVEPGLQEIIVPVDPQYDISPVVMDIPLPPDDEDRQSPDTIDRNPPDRDGYDRQYDPRWYH